MKVTLNGETRGCEETFRYLSDRAEGHRKQIDALQCLVDEMGGIRAAESLRLATMESQAAADHDTIEDLRRCAQVAQTGGVALEARMERIEATRRILVGRVRAMETRQDKLHERVATLERLMDDSGGPFTLGGIRARVTKLEQDLRDAVASHSKRIDFAQQSANDLLQHVAKPEKAHAGTDGGNEIPTGAGPLPGACAGHMPLPAFSIDEMFGEFAAWYMTHGAMNKQITTRRITERYGLSVAQLKQYLHQWINSL